MSVAALTRRGGDSNLPKTIPGLMLWLDARRPGGTYADQDVVTTWYDLSGLGNNVTQSVANKKPLWRASALNSKPAMTFDGSNDILTGPSWSLSQPTTRYVVFYTADHTIAAGQHLVSSQSSTAALRQDFFVNSSGAMALYANGQLTSTVTISDNQAVVGSAIANNTSSAVSINGANHTGTSGTGTWDSLSVGGRPSGAYLSGGIGIALVYAGAHSDGTRKNLERWLGRQYGITVTQ